MKKCWIAMGVSVAVIGTGAVAAPYWSGAQIEERFRGWVAASEQQFGYVTEIQSYERGLTQSKAVTVTRVVVDEDERFDVVFDHTMDHGPMLAQSAVALIESTLRLPGDEADEPKQVLDGEAPLKLVTRVHADGSQDIDVSAPQFEVQDDTGSGERLVFGGLSGTGKVAADTESLVVQLRVPSIQAITSGGRLTVTGISGVADAVRTDTPSLWLGDAEFNVTNLSFEPVPTDDLVPVVLDRLRFSSSVSNNDAGIDVTAGYGVNQLTVAGETVNDFMLDLSMGPLDRNALEQYLATAYSLQNQLATRGEDAADAGVDEILASVTQALTVGRPTARLKNMSFSYGNGRMDGKGSVQYVGDGDMAAFNPFTDVVAALSLTGTKAMVSTIMAEVLALQQYGGRLASLPEDVRHAVVGATRFQLDAVVRQGMVADAGDDYVVDASFKAGQLLVNGTPMPLPVPSPTPR